MSIELIPLGLLEHGENARQTQNPKHIAELAASIKSKGLKQNLQGSRKGKGNSTKVKIHAGHSRLDALVLLKSQKAVGHDGRSFGEAYEVPVLIEKLSQEEALEASLIENAQRQNLYPLEEAQAFHALVSQHGFSAEEVALRSGKSLEAALPPAALSDAWLKTLSKDRLTEVYTEVSQTPLVGSFTSKQLWGLILERAKGKADYLPKELTFHRTPSGPPATDEEVASEALEGSDAALEDAA